MEKNPEPRTDIRILPYNPDGPPVDLDSISEPNVAFEYHPSWLLFLKYIPMEKLMESDCDIASFLSLLQRPIETRPKIWLIDEVRKLSVAGHRVRKYLGDESFKSGEAILYKVGTSLALERKERFRSNYPQEEWGLDDSAFTFIKRVKDKLPPTMNPAVTMVGVLVYA